jgi:hypothetical protein
MEEDVFPRPAVAGVLQTEFIEARLHNDGGSKMEETRARQKEMTDSVATPIYVIVDPKSGVKLRLRAGYMGEETLLEFLRGGNVVD